MRHTQQRHRKRTSRALSRRMLLEPLEDRRMLATITVTSLSDGTLSALAGDGEVSLREAIQAANENVSVDGSDAGSPGQDNIVFEAGLNGQVFLQNGQFVVSEALEITGNGRTQTEIDGHDASRVFRATAGPFVLRGMTVKRGRTTSNTDGGGAVWFASTDGSLAILDTVIKDSSTQGSASKGGAIFGAGNVTIFNSEITGNSTLDDNASGGAIFGTKDIQIQFSTISGNATHGDLAHGGAVAGDQNISIQFSDLSGNATHGGDSRGGAVHGDIGQVVSVGYSTLDDNTAYFSGGAIKAHSLNLFRSVISNNTAVGGGGIASLYAIITDSTISGNSAVAGGGGVSAFDLAMVDSAVTGNRARTGGGISTDQGFVRSSTISANTVLWHGGGIYVSHASSQQLSLTVWNCTITGNRAQGGPSPAGGGISASSRSVHVAFSTITGNTVVGATSKGGGIRALDSDLILLSSIVAGNSASSGVAPDFQVDNLAYVDFSADYSLIGDNTDSPLAEANPSRDTHGNLVGGPVTGVVNPLLGVLKNRGGKTETSAPSLVSPALEFGVDQLGGFVPGNDQRGPGYPRDRDADLNGVSYIDAGAFEVNVIVKALLNFQIETHIFQVNYGTEDLAQFSPDNGSWEMYFDGSDVGLAGAAIDAHHQDVDGSILMSFGQIVTLPGVGDLFPADIVRFVPTSLGTQTAGSFELVHSGFELGLDAAIDNIDAIGRANDGRLVISTDDDVFLNFGMAQAHDLLAIDGNQLVPYFDGEQVGLDTADENITGVWFEPDTGLIFMTMQGTFNVDGLSGNAGDLIAFAPTSLEGDTAGKFYLFDSMPGMDLDQPLAGLNILYSDNISTTIGDWVFEDINQNGVQDVGEPGIEGVEIELLNPNGQVLAQTVTDLLGRYQFADLVAGAYRLRISVPTGFLLTDADQGGNDARDSDFQPFTQTSPLVSIAQGAVDTSLDAGLIRIVDGDFNDDGLYDCADVDSLVAAIAAANHNQSFDLTGDGLVNLADRDAWLAEAGEVNLGVGKVYLLGDATLDGTVDGQDFIAWNSNKFTGSAGWCGGDFTADGVTDGQDFILWNTNKFTGSDTVITINSDSISRADDLREMWDNREGFGYQPVLRARQFDGTVATDAPSASAPSAPPVNTRNFDARIRARQESIDHTNGANKLDNSSVLSQLGFRISR